MVSFKRSLKTTWWIFEITTTKHKHRTAVILRAILLLVPVLLGAGTTLALYTILPLLPALFFGAVSFIVSLTLMLQTDEEQEKIVNQYLSDESYIDQSIEYTPDIYLSEFIEDNVHPRFYQGVGAWIAGGHVAPEQFLSVIRVFDPYVDALADEDLLSLVQHLYLINTFAPRTRQDAVRIVPPEVPDSYPATILMPPYDNYVRLGGEFPIDAPITPSPFSFDKRPVQE